MTEYITKEQAELIVESALREYIRTGAVETAFEKLYSFPDADVAPVAHGKWEDLLCTDEQGNHYYWCTNCHTVLRTLNCNRIEWFSFCPNCGAKMKIPDNIDPAKAFTERIIDNFEKWDKHIPPDNFDPAKAFPERIIDDFEKWNKHIPQEVLDEIRKVVKEHD